MRTELIYSNPPSADSQGGQEALALRRARRPGVSQLQGRRMADTTDFELSAMMAQLRALIEVHPLDF